MTIVHTNRGTPVNSSAITATIHSADSSATDKAGKKSLVNKIRRAFKNRGKAAKAKLPAPLRSTLTSIRGIEPTGTSIVKATRNDRAAPKPDFMQGSFDQGLSEAEYNEGMSAAPTGGVLNDVMGDGFAEIARQAWQQLESKEALEAELKEGFAEIARQAWQQLEEKEAASSSNRDKTSDVGSVPTEPPPSYEEDLGIPRAPRHYTLVEIEVLERTQDPVLGEEDYPDLQRLNARNREDLLELARNLVPRFEGDNRDILYKIVRELRKTNPEFSRHAFNWMMDRAKQLANNEVLVQGLKAAVNDRKAPQVAKAANQNTAADAPKVAAKVAPVNAGKVADAQDQGSLADQLAKVRLRKAAVAPAAPTQPTSLGGALMQRVAQQAPQAPTVAPDAQSDDSQWSD